MKVNPLINTVNYAYSEYHKLIELAGSAAGSIGENGENLTIVVLSCNRSLLTIRMLDTIKQHIPHFAGTYLIIDNGSESHELMALYEAAQHMPYTVNMVELGQNYGVAGGRNRAVPHITTDWFLSLDNDIYFTANPLPHIKEAIETLGCHFLNMPLLNEKGDKIFARGGHLYLHQEVDETHVGGGSVFSQDRCVTNAEFEASLSTFLFGGASVINKHTFLHCGGYDEGMFIGFEDIDFSVTLFRKGYKIGNCGIACLIHDHKKPENKTDSDYEKERFSRDILKKSADYFKSKNNMQVWNNFVDQWLLDRKKELGLTEEAAEIPSEQEKQSLLPKAKNKPPFMINTNGKPKISLVVDSDKWAFANIAYQLTRYLSNEYDFKIIPMSVVEHIGRAVLLANGSDLTHFFWRMHISDLSSDWCRNYARGLGMTYDDFRREYIDTLRISTCVYDHLYLDDKKMAKSIWGFADNYYVSSNKLFDIYNNLDFVPKPAAVLPDGVDTVLFSPVHRHKYTLGLRNKRKLTIGWVGNSQWVVEDLKGINTVIRPAIAELNAEGYSFELITADRNDCFIPQHKMPDFYAGIDVYVCASKYEGTPNPVLEAMACGVPVISTDVGIVADVFGEKQRQYILKAQSVQGLKEMLLQLYHNRQVLHELSQENLSTIKSWDWKLKARAFKRYFEQCLGI